MNALVANYGRRRGNHDCNLEILGFPCNQFGLQEPGETPKEIINGLKYVRPGNGFQPAFQLFQKGDVNGEKENPMYTHLKSDCPLPGGLIASKASSILWSPVRNNDVHWNFEKFLIDHNGNSHKRFLSSVSPTDLSKDIEQLVSQCKAAKQKRESDVRYDFEDLE